MIFLQRQHKFFDFFAFPNFRKAAKFAASIEHPKPKMLQFQGGFAL